MTVVERLKEYRKLKAEIRAIELDIEELKDIENIGPAPISFEERTGKTYKFNSYTENLAVNLINKIDQLEYEKRIKEREIVRIENAIGILDEDEKMVVELRYLKGYKWDVISCRLDRSYQQCKRIEMESIEKIKSFL